MEFNNHTDTWKAFHTLYRASTKEGLAFLSPSWVRSQRYYKMGMKAKTSAEHDENEREILDTLEKENKKLAAAAAANIPFVTTITPTSEVQHDQQSSSSV